jgi:hypothetical protein
MPKTQTPAPAHPRQAPGPSTLTTEPETGHPKAEKPEAGRTRAGRPDASQTRTGAAQRDLSQPGRGQTQTGGRDVSQSQAGRRDSGRSQGGRRDVSPSQGGRRDVSPSQGGQGDARRSQGGDSGPARGARGDGVGGDGYGGGESGARAVDAEASARVEGGAPQYAVFLYDRVPAHELPDDVMRGHLELPGRIAERGGRVLAGVGLAGNETATALRNGIVTDGPFVETKEVMAGMYVLEARDLDHALELAALTPIVDGGVEVRPMLGFEVLG